MSGRSNLFTLIKLARCGSESWTISKNRMNFLRVWKKKKKKNCPWKTNHIFIFSIISSDTFTLSTVGKKNAFLDSHSAYLIILLFSAGIAKKKSENKIPISFFLLFYSSFFLFSFLFFDSLKSISVWLGSPLAPKAS